MFYSQVTLILFVHVSRQAKMGFFTHIFGSKILNFVIHQDDAFAVAFVEPLESFKEINAICNQVRPDTLVLILFVLIFLTIRGHLMQERQYFP